MRVRFAHLADYANVTQEGKFNIMGVFDVIHASGFPFAHPQMLLVIGFEPDISEQGQHKLVRVRLINDTGEKILEFAGRIVVGQATHGILPSHNHMLVLKNIAFPRPGTYQFDIEIDEQHAGDVKLKVVHQQSSSNM